MVAARNSLVIAQQTLNTVMYLDVGVHLPKKKQAAWVCFSTPHGNLDSETLPFYSSESTLEIRLFSLTLWKLFVQIIVRVPFFSHAAWADVVSRSWVFVFFMTSLLCPSPQSWRMFFNLLLCSKDPLRKKCFVTLCYLSPECV